MNYLMREQQEQEEDRYRKLDAAIRQRGQKPERKRKGRNLRQKKERL